MDLPLTASYPPFFTSLSRFLRQFYSKRHPAHPVKEKASDGKQAERQTFQVFTGAAPGGSSTSAIHGSRKTWKV
jgi:hypothetical protein